jgi:hypothetical protein
MVTFSVPLPHNVCGIYVSTAVLPPYPHAAVCGDIEAEPSGATMSSAGLLSMGDVVSPFSVISTEKTNEPALTAAAAPGPPPLLSP